MSCHTYKKLNPEQKNKSISAIVATSSFVKRQVITYSEEMKTILTVEDENAENKVAVDYYYNDDCLLFSGFGDVHIHAREDCSGKKNYKEDFLTASNAALNGGIVHVGEMPNNDIPPIDDESYLNKFFLTKKADIPFLLYGGIGPDTRPLKIRVPYKVYMGPSVGDLFFTSLDDLKRRMPLYENQHVSFHCEDPLLLEKNKKETTHLARRPVDCEVMATEKALEFIETNNLKGKLCHFSSGDGLELVRAAKERQVNVQVEVTPMHLFFSTENAINYFSSKEEAEKFLQMNPPIRQEKDRQSMLLAVKNGLIDYLATDHAPHTLEEKEQGISGMPGLDTYAGFVTYLIEKEGIAIQRISLMCSENPGSFFNNFLSTFSEHWPNMGKGFGFIEEGYSASFTILNLKKPYTVTKEGLKTKCKWSPFEGVTFPGSLESLFLMGKKVV